MIIKWENLVLSLSAIALAVYLIVSGLGYSYRRGYADGYDRGLGDGAFHTMEIMEPYCHTDMTR